MENIFNIEFPPITLPSGKSITFSSLSYKDKRYLLKNYDNTKGYAVEELIGAFALNKEEGVPISETIEDFGRLKETNGKAFVEALLARLDHWSFKDVMFYTNVITKILMLDEQEVINAEEVAKKLLTGTPSNITAPTSGSPTALPKGLKVERS